MTAGPIAARLRAAGCVFAEDEAQLLLEAADTPALLGELVDRRCAGEPLEYLLGWVSFRGRRVAIDRGVFVPRRRTEYLAQLAAGFAGDGDVVVDLCCGCGAIGAAVAAEVPGVELHAADVDPAAVRCARRNLPGPVYCGDLYAALPGSLRGRVNLLLVNAPYVPSGRVPLLPPEARDHEPRAAYDGGCDGLDVHRRVSAEAASWLAPGGRLLIEVGTDQVPTATAMLARDGLIPQVETCDDLAATVVIGARP
jgi:release factor glutamine methyltransferase